MSEEPPKQGNESAPSDRIESDVEPVTAPVIAEAVPGDSEAADAVRENLAAKEGKKTAATSVPAAGKGGNLTDKHEKHDDHGHGDHHENIWVTRGKYAVASLLAVFFQIFDTIGDAFKAGMASVGGGGGGGGHAKKDDHGHGGGGGHH